MSSKNGLRSMALAAAGVAMLAFSGQAKAEEPAFLALSGGVYDVADSFTAGEFRAEYRFAEKHKLWVFTPFVGVMGTTDSAVYGYAGIGMDIFFGRRVVLTPNFAVGAYQVTHQLGAGVERDRVDGGHVAHDHAAHDDVASLDLGHDDPLRGDVQRLAQLDPALDTALDTQVFFAADASVDVNSAADDRETAWLSHGERGAVSRRHALTPRPCRRCP